MLLPFCVLCVYYSFSFFSMLIQEQQFGELEKNSDKQLSVDSQGQTDPPSHFHQLLSGLHKHLLGHCYIHSNLEVQREKRHMTTKTK